MNALQSGAFQAGSGVEPDALNLLLLGLLCAVLLIWVAWTLLVSFRGLATDQLTWRQFSAVGTRALLLTLVSFWLVLH